ncbi:hypothetical protein CKO09_07110 [Chromatium weissei]|nr:hypothetical protein [Chromatium weissei]
MVSTAALLLALSQPLFTAQADEQAVPAAASAPAAQPAPAAPEAVPSFAEAARAQAEARRAAMNEQRKQRYNELRARAAEIGMDMPEQAPWEMPFPAIDDAAMKQWQNEVKLRQQERLEQQEKMRNMTPEERRAQHEQRWKQMQDEAAARGMEMPPMPNWEEVEKRHQEMNDRFDQYRKTVEQFSDEQREAARAVFGRSARSHARDLPCNCPEMNAPPRPPMPMMPPLSAPTAPAAPVPAQ